MMDEFNEKQENPFGLSMGDLMAALLMIFVLILSGTLLKLQDEFDQKSDVAERYKELQVDLYNDLHLEFHTDLKRWNAQLDSTLTIRFTEPDVLFDKNKSKLKDRFKSMLDEFFVRYITILRKDKYRNHIKEIRIEGHTSNEKLDEPTGGSFYFYNMKLSQDRTRSVLRYTLSLLTEPDVKDWTVKRTTANGLSSVKPIANNKTKEGQKLNRRVEFSIQTDAEQQLWEMLKVAETDEH